MNEHKGIFRGLVVSHLIIGAMLAAIAICFPSIRWPSVVEVVVTGFIISETLLVGFWLGLARASWKNKFAVLVLNVAWLGFVCLPLARLPTIINDFLILLLMLALPMIVIAGAIQIFRRSWAIEHRDVWPTPSISQEMRFGIKFLFVLTAVIAVLFAGGRVAQWMGGESAGFYTMVPVFVLLSLLSAFLLIWAMLGNGCLRVRLPVMLIAMTLVGILPPYYTDSMLSRYLWWPALTATIAIITSCSLLVVRSCGYRWHKADLFNKSPLPQTIA